MILTILVFLLILFVIVLVHEIGHFYTARKLGIGVEEFGVGFPPRLFSFKKNGIIYSFNLIPIGGFVKIKGESGDNNDADSFISQPIWKRGIVLVSGVFMNMVLAFIIISIGFGVGIPSAVDGIPKDAKIKDQKIQIINVYPNSPADKSGIKLGDYILSLDKQKFSSSEKATEYIGQNQDKEIAVSVSSSGEEKIINIKPETIQESGDKKIIGVAMVDVGLISYPWYKAPLHGFKSTVNLTVAISEALYDLVVGLFQGKGAPDVSGPIGVAVFTGRARSMGFEYILQLMALLSINLAIINILPFPALDGGRVLFLIIEKIRKKQNNQKLEAVVNNIGFGLLMLLMLLVTYKDVLKYIFHK